MSNRFLNNVISQLGRDTGKVISNSIFGNAHATPVRVSGGQAKLNYNTKVTKRQFSDFEKALNFDRSLTPKNLVRKLQAVSILLTEETEKFISDGYLSVKEDDEAFTMFNKFVKKAESVASQLELEEEANKTELQVLEKLVIQTENQFHALLRESAEGCEMASFSLKESAVKKSKLNFFRWILLNTFFMRGYAKTGEKKLASTILANILLFGGQIIMFLVGLLSFPFEINSRKKLKALYLSASEQELKRANKYLEIVNDNKTIEN